MVDVEHIADWRGQDVVDVHGEKLGKLADVWYRLGTNDAVFATVKSGLLGRHATLVPLTGASLSRDYVRLGIGREALPNDSRPSEEGVITPARGAELAEAFGLQLDTSIGWESAEAREARLARAEEARQRAAELDAESEAQATRGEELRQQAEQLVDDAQAADERSLRAREEAVTAREQAAEEERPPEV